MHGIVTYHQDIYIHRERDCLVSNGVSPHVCATRGPDLHMANDVIFCAFGGGKWWRREGSSLDQ